MAKVFLTSGTLNIYVASIRSRSLPKKKLCTLLTCNFNTIKKEIPCSATPLLTCVLIFFFTLSSFPFPLEALRGLI
jgi:hypothetical protein